MDFIYWENVTYADFLLCRCKVAWLPVKLATGAWKAAR